MIMREIMGNYKSSIIYDWKYCPYFLGSIIAIKEAYESWEKVNDGTGTKAEAIADTIWAWVSVILDGVTIVMAATWVSE